MSPEADAVFKGRVFLELWLDAQALLAGKVAQVLAMLQQGLQTAEHAAFADALRQKA